jgi:hypothetical protein
LLRRLLGGRLLGGGHANREHRGSDNEENGPQYVHISLQTLRRAPRSQ